MYNLRAESYNRPRVVAIVAHFLLYVKYNTMCISGLAILGLMSRLCVFDSGGSLWHGICYNADKYAGTVGLAQLVRASDCGPEGRWFNSSIPPHEAYLRECSTAVSMQVFQT